MADVGDNMEIELVKQPFNGGCALLVNGEGEQFRIEIDGPVPTAPGDNYLFWTDDHAVVKVRGAG